MKRIVKVCPICGHGMVIDEYYNKDKSRHEFCLICVQDTTHKSIVSGDYVVELASKECIIVNADTCKELFNLNEKNKNIIAQNTKFLNELHESFTLVDKDEYKKLVSDRDTYKQMYENMKNTVGSTDNGISFYCDDDRGLRLPQTRTLFIEIPKTNSIPILEMYKEVEDILNMTDDEIETLSKLIWDNANNIHSEDRKKWILQLASDIKIGNLSDLTTMIER